MSLENENLDVTCEHGVALDVHCCNCHSGFIFDKDHECPKPQPDFWRCKTCGCLWCDNHDDSVSLGSVKQTSCLHCEDNNTLDACEPLYRVAGIPVVLANKPPKVSPADPDLHALALQHDKIIALLKSVAAPCDMPTKGNPDHAWRKCRHCLAIQELDLSDIRGLLHSLIVDIEAALCAVRRAQDWQPIATAPKDGRTLILFDPADAGDIGINAGYFHSEVGAWIWADDGCEAIPTHWRPPLPAPPKETP